MTFADKLLSTFNPARGNKKDIRTQYGELWRPFDALNVSRQRGHSPFGALPQYLLRYLLECSVKGGKHLARHTGRVYLRSQTKVNNAVSTVRVQIILQIRGQWFRARYRNMNTSDFLKSWRERTRRAHGRMAVRQDQRYPRPEDIEVGQIVTEMLFRDLVTRSIGKCPANLGVPAFSLSVDATRTEFHRFQMRSIVRSIF